jgi:beta-lactamase regulating signal transducer with metallopeptidase domain
MGDCTRRLSALLTAIAVSYAVAGALACALLATLVHGVVHRVVDVTPLLAVALAGIAMLAVGAPTTARGLRRQLVATYRLSRRVSARRVAPPMRLQQAAAAAGLRRIVMTDEPGIACFTYGLRPRVAVSRGLLDTLDQRELIAALAHEAHHVRNRDPLRLLLVRSIPCPFACLPFISRLRDGYLAQCELAADRAAIRAQGSPALAGALYKVAAAGVPVTGAVAAMASDDVLGARVTQLEQGRAELGVRRWDLIAVAVWSVSLVGRLGIAVQAAGGWDVVRLTCAL